MSRAWEAPCASWSCSPPSWRRAAAGRGRRPARARRGRWAPTSFRRPVDECDGAGRGWRELPTPGIYGAPAAYLGNGRVGIVFADDSDNDPCAWLSEARSLVAKGYAVALFNAGGTAGARQAITVVSALRRTGPRRIVLIGASVGARAVLQAGASHPRGVAGMVALSAERRVASSPADLLPVGRHVRVPVLSIGSRGDPLLSDGKDTVAWDRAIPHDTALVLSGGDHGVDLPTRRHRARAAILRFLATR